MKRGPLRFDFRFGVSLLVGVMVSLPLFILMVAVFPLIQNVAPFGAALFRFLRIEQFWHPLLSVPLLLTSLWLIGRLALARWFRNTVGAKILDRIPLVSLLWKFGIGIADNVERMKSGTPVIVYQWGRSEARRYRLGFVVGEIAIGGNFPHATCLLVIFVPPQIFGADAQLMPPDSDVWVIEDTELYQIFFAVLTSGFALPQKLKLTPWQTWKAQQHTTQASN